VPRPQGSQSRPHAAPFRRLIISREPLELREFRDGRKFAVFFAYEDSLGQIAVHSDRLANESETLRPRMKRKSGGDLPRVGKEPGLPNNGPGNVHKLDGLQPAYCFGIGAHASSWRTYEYSARISG
jgi:hypothetical protein